MITYFVLKDEGGKAAGCVRLENGKVRSTCPCTLLLEDDTALALGDDETPLPARALGAAVLNGVSERCAEVELDGGRLYIEWAEDNHIYMTGPAERVFSGTYEGESNC